MKPYQLLPLIVTIVFGFFLSTVSAQDNTQLRHALVDGHEYEGYYVSGGEGTLLLLLLLLFTTGMAFQFPCHIAWKWFQSINHPKNLAI